MAEKKEEGMNLLTVVLAEKTYHVGALHGMIQRGGQIPLNKEGCSFAIRFIPLGKEFIVLQLASIGINSRFKYGLLRKTTPSKVKKKLEKVEVVDGGNTSLFD